MKIKFNQKIIVITIIIFLLSVSLPLAQGFFNFLPEVDLNGLTEEVERPRFSFDSWFNKDFQNQFEAWLEGRIGLRGYFIKTDNEINYFLFNEIHQKTHNKIVVGDDDYLFENSYIKSYLGRDYQAVDALEEKIIKLKELQNKLKQADIASIFLISPSKASFFSEHIPPELIFDTIDKNPKTNYERVLPMLKEYKVEYLDGRDFLLERKNSSKYPLFPKGGTHWTRYGSCLVLDDILKKTGKQLKQEVRLPDCENVSIYNEPKFEDRDLIDLANLWSDERFKEKLAYPKNSEENQKPNDINLLVIGDSFTWGILNNIQTFKSVADYNFYYYFNSDYKENDVAQPIDKDSKKLKEQILKNNLIIIEVNESGLSDIGFGFIEAALEALEIE